MANVMGLPLEPALPWLLYAYPWMPYPRRTIIYLREKGIPSDLVQVVHVSDPQHGNEVIDKSLPPRPPGSLPILAIRSADNDENGNPKQSFLVRQSMAIIHLLEEVCEKKMFGFDVPFRSLVGRDLADGVRVNEVLSLAEQCTSDWNPVRTFGTRAGTISYPPASKEMLRWVRRSLLAIEKWWEEADRDMSLLRQGVDGHVTLADIVLYQFLEFTRDCYRVDMTAGSGKTVKDVYGGNVVEEYPKLREFFEAFSARDSANRNIDEGDVAGEAALTMMQSWAEGVLE